MEADEAARRPPMAGEGMCGCNAALLSRGGPGRLPRQGAGDHKQIGPHGSRSLSPTRRRARRLCVTGGARVQVVGR